MSEYGMPLPRIVNASPRLMVRRRLPIFKYFFSPAQAARKATPCGTSPVLTMRQSAMSNLRARATIMILRAPRTSLVTDRYHCTRALYFWNMRKRQASWIMPRRTRALPGRCGQLAMQRVGVDLPRRRHVGAARGPAAHGPDGIRPSATSRDNAPSGQLVGSWMRMRAMCTITRAPILMRRCRIVANSHLASGLVCGIAARTPCISQNAAV